MLSNRFFGSLLANLDIAVVHHSVAFEIRHDVFVSHYKRTPKEPLHLGFLEAQIYQPPNEPHMQSFMQSDFHVIQTLSYNAWCFFPHL